jgi:ketosteroid isomerase-like protein
MTANEAWVREGLAAFNGGDREAWLALIDPSARFYPVDFMPDWETVFEGREGLASFWDSWHEPWDRLRAEVVRIDVDGDVVAFDVRWIGERAGAPPVEMPLGAAVKVRDGLLTLMVAASTAADARDKLLALAAEPSGGSVASARIKPEVNVDRFVRGIEAFNRHDMPGLLRVLDPEIVWEHHLAELQGTFVGPEAVVGWCTDLYEHFQTVEIDCPDVRDLGDDRVLGLGTIRSTGKGSGAETELTFATVARYRNGRLIHYVDFGDRDQALEAAGLSE